MRAKPWSVSFARNHGAEHMSASCGSSLSKAGQSIRDLNENPPVTLNRKKSEVRVRLQSYSAKDILSRGDFDSLGDSNHGRFRFSSVDAMDLEIS
jgi:hypothetical protein